MDSVFNLALIQKDFFRINLFGFVKNAPKIVLYAAKLKKIIVKNANIRFLYWTVYV